jgi:hypothetical protein
MKRLQTVPDGTGLPLKWRPPENDNPSYFLRGPSAPAKGGMIAFQHIAEGLL